MNVVVFDFSNGRRGTVAGDEADLCRSCDIFFSYLCVVFCFLVAAILFTGSEDVRSVVYVAMFFFVCV